jgi:hypothetical protein
MTNSSLNIGQRLLLASFAGTSTLVSTSYTGESNNIPSLTAKYEIMIPNYSWEEKEGTSKSYSIVCDLAYLNVLESFSIKLLSDMRDIDEDIAKDLNKFFWNML